MENHSKVSFNSTAWLSQEQVLSLPDGTELIEGARNATIVLTEVVRMNINAVFSDAHGLIRMNHEL